MSDEGQTPAPVNLDANHLPKQARVLTPEQGVAALHAELKRVSLATEGKLPVAIVAMVKRVGEEPQLRLASNINAASDIGILLGLAKQRVDEEARVEALVTPIAKVWKGAK